MLSKTGEPLVKVKPTRLGALRAARAFFALPLFLILVRWLEDENLPYYFFAVTIFYLFISRLWEQVQSELYNLVIVKRFRRSATDKDSITYRMLDREISRKLKYIQASAMSALLIGTFLDYTLWFLVLNDFAFLYFFHKILKKTFKLRDVYNRIRNYNVDSVTEDVCKQD